ncbi:MAG: cofactor-independent phosphoglycerate mutase [Thermodesulfovibrionia bacterium]
MKYIVLIGDGMADMPIKKLGYKTCLQKASTPNMDRIAAQGEPGSLKTIPSGFAPGSDVANLSVFGYNPSKYYSGRAALEAAYRGVKLKPGDIAFRCNLVTLKFTGSKNRDNALMQDYSAGHISTREATLLIKAINNKLGSDRVVFYPGMSYRHLMVWKKGKQKTHCTPPHDITGKKIKNYLPEGNGGSFLRELMEKSTEILMAHPVNKKRIELGLPPANNLWFWGQGKSVYIPKFKEKYNLKGTVISAVDLIKGLGICAGFDVMPVKGATGYLDTNYIGKARAALRALESVDIVYLHVEAPDEASHSGNIKEKIKAIENFDTKVVGTVLRGIKKFKKYSILLLPDHATPVSIKSHTDDPVPFAIYRSAGSDSHRGCRGKGMKNAKPEIKSFSEDICKTKHLRVFEKGYKLMDYFIRGK